MSLDQLVVLLVRCGLVVLFLPFSALDKVFNFSGAVGQASETFSFRPLAGAASAAGLGIEIFMSLGIILGLVVIVAAFGLTGLYVSRANREFDRLAADIRESVR